MGQNHPKSERRRSTERCFAYLLVAIALAFSVYWIHALAERADDRSHKVERQVERSLIQDSLKAERVCSRTNQVPACRELFDRLAKNITHAQRHRLGCAALEGLLPNDKVAAIRKESNCPTPRTRQK